MDFRGIRKGDLLVIVVLVSIGLATLAYNHFFVPAQPQGNTAEVEVDGRLVNTYSLGGEQQTIRVDTENGFNVLQIQDEQIGIIEASCPDQVCVHSGWKQRIGQIIVCLPHRLIVRISGDDSIEDQLDGVTY